MSVVLDTTYRPRVNLETSISVDRVSGQIYHQNIPKIRLGHRGPYVMLMADGWNFPAFITTKQATDVGLDLCRKMGPLERDPDLRHDLVLLTINGRDIMLLPDAARQIGGVLLRKAERADAFQHGTRIEDQIVDPFTIRGRKQ